MRLTNARNARVIGLGGIVYFNPPKIFTYAAGNVSSQFSSDSSTLPVVDTPSHYSLSPVNFLDLE